MRQRSFAEMAGQNPLRGIDHRRRVHALGAGPDAL